MKESAPQQLSNPLLEAETPGEKRLREGIAKLDPVRFKVLEALSELLEKENSNQVLSDIDYERYFQVIPKIVAVLDQIISQQVITVEDKEKMRVLCSKKQELVNSLPEKFGIRRKVGEITYISEVEGE